MYSEPLLKGTQRHTAASTEAPAQGITAASEHQSERATRPETTSSQVITGSTTSEQQHLQPDASDIASEFAMPVGKNSSENADVDWLAPNTAVQSQQATVTPRMHAQSQALEQRPSSAAEPSQPSSTEQHSAEPGAAGLTNEAKETPTDHDTLAAGMQSPTAGSFLGEAAASNPSASHNTLKKPHASPIKSARATSQQVDSSSSAEGLEHIPSKSATEAVHDEAQHQSKADTATVPQSTANESAAQEQHSGSQSRISDENVTAANQDKAGRKTAAAEHDQDREPYVKAPALSGTAQADSYPSKSQSGTASGASEHSLQAAAPSRASREANQHESKADGKSTSAASAEFGSLQGKTL